MSILDPTMSTGAKRVVTRFAAEIKTLKAQIDRMKCCANCAWADLRKPYQCGDCVNNSEWKDKI